MQKKISARLKSNEARRSNYEGPKLLINPRCRSSQPFQVKLNYNSLLMKVAEKSHEPSNRGASPDDQANQGIQSGNRRFNGLIRMSKN